MRKLTLELGQEGLDLRILFGCGEGGGFALVLALLFDQGQAGEFGQSWFAFG